MRALRFGGRGAAAVAGRRSLLASPIWARRAASASGPDDLLKEGAEVEFVTGGRGFLVEKSKGGWWKVAVNQTESSSSSSSSSNNNSTNPLVVKVRTSAFRLTAASPLAGTSTRPPAPSALSDIDAALAELTTAPDSLPAPYTLPTIEPPPLHAATKKWVIFSDLHVKGSSMDCCAEVLREVHEAALARDAGIIFLGDFWHVRGALNVELLNRVLRSLRQWTQPVIMIPGNHDQVTLGGAVHALEPLIYAFRPEQCLLISEPAVCLGALWIPYRRDPRLMQRILQAGADSPDVGIIYCHADVRGAYMNDGMRSREGLDIATFPPGLPIYSGHFHKPHTMTKGRSSLRYVGSPYQTSLSEAGQDKFLYCMSNDGAADWKEEERWVLDVGRKYFKALSVSDPCIAKARQGDRVVLPVRVGEDAAAEAVLQQLRTRGVEVELRRERLERPSGRAAAAAAGQSASSSSSASTSGSADGKSSLAGITDAAAASPRDPIELFVDFMGTGYAQNATSSSSSPRPATSSSSNSTLTPAQIQAAEAERVRDELASAAAKQALHAAVLQEGRETLLRLMNTEAGAGAGARIAGGKVSELRMESVVLSNFGPFGGEKVSYPLSQRGLVLIRGQSTDGTGADSNGAGKTTLAMSVMWALTGSMDARLVADGKAVDVAFDAGTSAAKRTAEVTLRGQINGKPFELTRRRGARKADLSFVVDGKDLTTLAVKDTQAVVDETLGIGDGLLQRCCFFGQHSHTLQSLLGLTDVRLKSELSCLVDTELWTMSAVDVRSRERADKTRVAELAVEARVRGEELERSQAAAATAAAAVADLEAKLEAAREAALAEMGRSRLRIAERFGNSSIAHLISEIEASQRAAEAFRADTLEPMRAAVLDAVRRHASATAALDQANSALRERVSQFRAASATTASALSSLQNKTRQLDLQAKGLELTVRNLCAQYAVSARHLLPAPATSPAAQLSPESISAERTRGAYEEALLALANLEVRIAAADKSLANLRSEAERDAGAAATGPATTAAAAEAAGAACTAHAAEHCPTCGQSLPASMRQAREAELTKELASLTAQQTTQSAVADDLRLAVDQSLHLAQARTQLAALAERRAELVAETQTLEESRRAKEDETSKLERDLALRTVERADFERDWRRAESDKESDVAAATERLQEMQAREAALRKTLDEFRAVEATSTTQQGEANATVVLLEDRVRQARDKHDAQAGELQALQAVMASLRAQERDIASRGLVLERLAEVLGPRGIQHYVFIGVLKQLETIANAYLQVLADGGVQLTLQGDDDADRIVKAVWVRSADGTMRERGLSQLSGGQWRRVSMALDLAFAEIIRRRGTLRSNLIVMDEVLTHLDASGREAVGSVLRAMVDGPRAGEAWPDVDDEAATATGETRQLGVADADPAAAAAAAAAAAGISNELARALLGGGAYETAIVILQDLSAMELEEAFDHVDIVVKAADTSKVIIDGERGQ